MRRFVLVLAAIAAAAIVATMPLRGVPSSPTEPAAPEMPVSNTAAKASRLDSAAAALAGYLIVQTETAPISRGLAAAMRVAMETPVPRPPPPEPAREEPTGILLNNAQIAALRQRLDLTAAQEQHWPAVEAALRAYVTRQYELQKKRPRAVIQPDPDSVELQNLRTAAAALLASLDDRQKGRIRVLAGMVGLGDVVAKL